MPTQDYIDVRILVNGLALMEYLDPTGAPDREYCRDRYIEVKARQTFGVKVTLLPGFNFRFARHLLWEIDIGSQET